MIAGSCLVFALVLFGWACSNIERRSVPDDRRVLGEWTMWGGSPSRNMVAPGASGIPERWDISSGENIRWSVELGSQCYAGPIVARGKVFVGSENHRAHPEGSCLDFPALSCFRAHDGELLWQAVHESLPRRRVSDWVAPGLASTPAVVGDRIYYMTPQGAVVCLDTEGFLDGEDDGPQRDGSSTSKSSADFVWTVDLRDELGVIPHNVAASCPLVVWDRVYVVTGNGVERDHITVAAPDAPSFVALDRFDGRVVWTRAIREILHGQWSAPTWSEAGGRPQVLFPGGDGWLYSLDPDSGEILWKFDTNPKDSVWELGGLGTRNSLLATAVAVGDRVFIASGQDPEHGDGPGMLWCLDSTGSGDVTDTAAHWSRGPRGFPRSISTVAVADGLLYAAVLSGWLYCLDAETGRLHWRYDSLAAIWSSPVVADGWVVPRRRRRRDRGPAPRCVSRGARRVLFRDFDLPDPGAHEELALRRDAEDAVRDWIGW